MNREDIKLFTIKLIPKDDPSEDPKYVNNITVDCNGRWVVTCEGVNDWNDEHIGIGNSLEEAIANLIQEMKNCGWDDYDKE